MFPWDGASDTRVRLADAVINESADILDDGIPSRNPSRITNGDQRCGPGGSGDHAASNYYRQNKLRSELRQEAGLLASFGLQYGFAALHVRWDREVTKKMMPITMEDLVRDRTAGRRGICAWPIAGPDRRPRPERCGG